ncbi:hypothetical protein CRYUN_Cryun13aG0134800 [Craigia yunnanensis]
MQGDNLYEHLVNKRLLWMEKKSLLSLSNTLSHHHHLQEETDPPQVDRISDLLDDILHLILSLMPMQMSIRTSILSKRWRHLWKYTHVVDFNSLPLYKKVDYTPIFCCLDHLESPNIKSFTVVGHVRHRSHPDVRKWVHFALSKNVHTLRIGLMSTSYPMRFFLLPKSLFTKNDQTQNLEELFLSCVDYTPPRGVTFSGSGFGSLRTLKFASCKLSDWTLELLLLKCLVLEVLVLDRCEGLANVNISGLHLKLKYLVFKWNVSDDGELKLLEVDAPYLLTLRYSGGLTKIHLINCQGLQEAVLLGEEEQINEANTNHIRDLMNQVSQVKTLGVNFQFLQFVAKEYYTRGNPFSNFQNLEHLFWHDSLGSQNDVYNLVAFLGDCPSLEDCEIDFRKVNWPAFCDTLWESVEEPIFDMIDDAQDQLYHGRCLEKLKAVQIICFSGFESEMMLVKLLLKKAVNLQTLEFFWRKSLSSMTDSVLQIDFTEVPDPALVANIQKDQIKEKVTSFSKASPNAEVRFYRDWEFCEWYETFEVLQLFGDDT